MNYRQTYAMLNVATGVLQETAGNFTGNKTRQIEGVRRQVLGRADADLENSRDESHSFRAYAGSTSTLRQVKTGTEET